MNTASVSTPTLSVSERVKAVAAALVIGVALIYTTGFARWRVVLRDEIPYDPAKPETLTADINTVSVITVNINANVT